VGWCQLTPRRGLDRLNSSRTIAAVDELPVWALSCFYVRRGYRRQGVATALVDAALKYAKRGKAPALEAYPYDREGTKNHFMGTISTFARVGFKEIARRSPVRPIMRHDLKNLRKSAR
jgi:GNAT superfamily N-acetyltransferase